LLPFLFFLWRGWIEPGLRWRLWGILGLGAVQGAVGWWMVSSGLAERTSVSQYRLAFHLTLACVIFAATVWTWRRLVPEPEVEPDGRMRATAFALLGLVLVQIYLGALVAGLDAGLVYNTWPEIDGAFVPAADRLFFLAPAWRNFFENDLMVQFVHRIVAYTLWIVAVLHAIDAWRRVRSGAVVAMAVVIAFGITAQAAVGIATLLYQVPISLALTHQGVAVVILTLVVMHAERITRQGAVRRPMAGAVAASR
ncbi:MAG: COX15/CtaA family protein, partial [Variibacter sp.]|nr:COX15/CtaA family protein [Variibacter sp.]